MIKIIMNRWATSLTKATTTIANTAATAPLPSPPPIMNRYATSLTMATQAHQQQPISTMILILGYVIERSNSNGKIS